MKSRRKRDKTFGSILWKLGNLGIIYVYIGYSWIVENVMRIKYHHEPFKVLTWDEEKMRKVDEFMEIYIRSFLFPKRQSFLISSLVCFMTVLVLLFSCPLFLFLFLLLLLLLYAERRRMIVTSLKGRIQKWCRHEWPFRRNEYINFNSFAIFMWAYIKYFSVTQWIVSQSGFPFCTVRV